MDFQPYLIKPRQLEAFNERLVLRDPRARTSSPSLLNLGSEGVLIQGPFQIRRRLLPTKARGLRFVGATAGPSPLHREGEVVPGAFLAAQLVSTTELLLPSLRTETLRVSFSGVCWYDRALRLTLRCEPRQEDGEARMHFRAIAYQDEREVGHAELSGRFLPTPPLLELPLDQVDATWLMRVLEFYAAMGIDPAAYFHKATGSDLSYPISFLASLPSGSMVKRFSGQGGILNRLTLEFSDTKLPLRGPPEVGLKPPKRLRQSFNKILTWVKEGVETAVRGTALVLPRPPQDVFDRAR